MHKNLGTYTNKKALASAFIILFVLLASVVLALLHSSSSAHAASLRQSTRAHGTLVFSNDYLNTAAVTLKAGTILPNARAPYIEVQLNKAVTLPVRSGAPVSFTIPVTVIQYGTIGNIAAEQFDYYGPTDPSTNRSSWGAANTAPFTGGKDGSSTHAYGMLDVDNESFTATVHLKAGTILKNVKSPSIQVVLLQDVTVPPGIPGITSASVLVQVVQTGTIGNIAAEQFDYDGPIDSSSGRPSPSIENVNPFTGGMD
jgi:hypothetical protein